MIWTIVNLDRHILCCKRICVCKSTYCFTHIFSQFCYFICFIRAERDKHVCFFPQHFCQDIFYSPQKWTTKWGWRTKMHSGVAGAVKMQQRKKSCLTCALSLCEPTILWYWRANVCIYSLLYSPLLTKCAFTLQHQLHSVTVPSRPHHHSDKLHCHRESHFPTFPSPVKKKKNTHYPLLFCVALHPIVPPHSTP